MGRAAVRAGPVVFGPLTIETVNSRGHIAIVCSDPSHDGRLPVVAEFERDEIAQRSHQEDWRERTVYRRGAQLVEPARGPAGRLLGADGQPVSAEDLTPTLDEARDVTRWPDVVARVRYEFTCGVCKAGPVRARHDKLKVILDRLQAARQDQISLKLLESALAIVHPD